MMEGGFQYCRIVRLINFAAYFLINSKQNDLLWQYDTTMTKVLLYSKDPKTNYKKFKSSCILILPLYLLISIMLYFSKGLTVSVITFFVLLGITGIEFYLAKSCQNETDPSVLEKAYKNGLIVNFVIKACYCLLMIYLFGLLYGILLSLIVVVGSLLILKKES